MSRSQASALSSSLAACQAAVKLADIVDCDVPASRGRLEVRHSKALGPLPWLWDRGPFELTPRSVAQLRLDELLKAPGPTLMLDLKGAGRVGPRTAQVLRAQPLQVLAYARW